MRIRRTDDTLITLRSPNSAISGRDGRFSLNLGKDHWEIRVRVTLSYRSMRKEVKNVLGLIDIQPQIQ